MNIKKQIVKILLMLAWLVLGSGVLVLLVAAKNIKNAKTCKGILVEISGAKEFVFLDKQDIMGIINNGGEGRPEGQVIANFNLRSLESALKKNVWVSDADLYFDNNLWLHVNVVEKEPVARIFTSANASFYIDSTGAKLPLSNKVTVRLPVFTGYPSGKSKSKAADSLLLEHTRKLSRYILNSEFWMAQVAQVAITPDRNFEMIPTIGRHVIQFGDGENYEDKFRRLFIFYRQVLSKVGFDKYSRVIVQYDKQVIGTTPGPMPKIDSMQALKNIQKMIEESRKISDDSSYAPPDTVTPVKEAGESSLSMENTESLPIEDSSGNAAEHTKSAVPAKKLIKEGKPAKSGAARQIADKPKPKAVMKKSEAKKIMQVN